MAVNEKRGVSAKSFRVLTEKEVEARRKALTKNLPSQTLIGTGGSQLSEIKTMRTGERLFMQYESLPPEEQRTHEKCMRDAIKVTLEGIEEGNTPFGAVIISPEGKTVSRSHNTVWQPPVDPTRHAENNAINEAFKTLNLKNPKLEGHTLYTTCEPCPMCLSAAHWAGIGTVVFGARIGDAQKAGFTELTISAEDMIRLGGSQMKVVEGVLEGECRQLFDIWKRKGKSGVY
ncbi:MAG: nucleoside deaminase [Candidatus Altiarchaeota archaeon]